MWFAGFFKDLCNVMRQIISQDWLLCFLKRTPRLSQQKEQNEEAQRQQKTSESPANSSTNFFRCDRYIS